jgi:hypothetical protein
MIGGTGPRLLSIALPHCDAWNTWFDWYGNTAEGFAEKSAAIPAGIEKSACVYVELEGGTGARANVSAAQPVPGDRTAEHLRELAEAGADEAILVADPIDERSIRTLGDALS